MDIDVGTAVLQRRRPKLTLDDARRMIQASDAELDKGLRDRRVLILDGTPSPAAPVHRS